MATLGKHFLYGALEPEESTAHMTVEVEGKTMGLCSTCEAVSIMKAGEIDTTTLSLAIT